VKNRAAEKLKTAIERVGSRGLEVTHDSLVSAGFPGEYLAQMILIQFPEGCPPWTFFRPYLRTTCHECGTALPDAHFAQWTTGGSYKKEDEGGGKGK